MKIIQKTYNTKKGQKRYIVIDTSYCTIEVYPDFSGEISFKKLKIAMTCDNSYSRGDGTISSWKKDLKKEIRKLEYNTKQLKKVLLFLEKLNKSKLRKILEQT